MLAKPFWEAVRSQSRAARGGGRDDPDERAQTLATRSHPCSALSSRSRSLSSFHAPTDARSRAARGCCARRRRGGERSRSRLGVGAGERHERARPRGAGSRPCSASARQAWRRACGRARARLPAGLLEHGDASERARDGLGAERRARQSGARPRASARRAPRRGRRGWGSRGGRRRAARATGG